MKGRNSSQGFTLIEALIALIVLAVGLLGMASLMVNSLQSSQSAYMRSQASILAYDIVERMRTNRSAATDPSVNIYTQSEVRASDGSGCADGCNPQQQARLDVAQWRAALADRMPGATAQITRTVVDDMVAYQIRINWTDSGNQTLSDSSFDLRVDL